MLNLTKQELDEHLNLKEGFVVRNISSEDLEVIRNMVNLHWKKVLLTNYPKKFNNSELVQIYDYHKISDQIDHKKLWPMKNRILSLNDYKIILSTNLFKNIRGIYADAEISDENNIGHGEIYWRIVRPKSPKDIGSVHADKWFWDINDDYTPQILEELSSGYLYGVKAIMGWVLYQIPKNQNMILITNLKMGKTNLFFYLKRIILSYLR